MQCPCLRDATQIFYMYMTYTNAVHCTAFVCTCFSSCSIINAAPSEPRCTVSMAWTSAMSLTVCEYDCTHVVHRDPDPTVHLHVVTELIMFLQCSLFQHCYASTVVGRSTQSADCPTVLFRLSWTHQRSAGQRNEVKPDVCTIVDLLCQIAQPGKPLSGAHNNMTVYNVRVMCCAGVVLPGASKLASEIRCSPGQGLPPSAKICRNVIWQIRD